MSDLFWPGDDRAGDLLSQQAFLDAMVRVESAWVDADLPQVLAHEVDADDGGSPVIAVVRLLRERTGDDRVHRGLTSQDVIDTALVLCLRDVVARLVAELGAQAGALAALADRHRGTATVARTLTQHAVPSTFGVTAAHWLVRVLDASDDLSALRFLLQLGGAAGTMAAAVELGRDPAQERARMADRLGLLAAPAWHTDRRPLTRIGDALVACTDAWGAIASDVLTLNRPEIAELSEPSPGGSSTMPHKQNPVLSVLVRRAALTSPQLGATLHLAAATQVDQRADGAWHAEWATARDLGRRTAVAASHTTELVSGLVVHADRMGATLRAAGADVRAEQAAMAAAAGHPPAPDYLGEAETIIDAALTRAQEVR